MNFIDSLNPQDVSLSIILKPYQELCDRQNVQQIRLAVVQRNLTKCLEENTKIAEESQISREISRKAAEKLKRISSLCIDLGKRFEASAHQRHSNLEHSIRGELNDSFAIDVQDISKRIEDVAASKQLNSIANESLRLQLTSSIDNFHIAESPRETEDYSFEAEFLVAEESISQSTELSLMEYEDYLGHLGCSIVMQVALRELLSSYNDKFQGFQIRLAENNEMFESHRQRIDKVSEVAKAKHVVRSEATLEIKGINKLIKAQSLVFVEHQKDVEKEKLKEEKLLKLIQVFETDIADMEIELAARQKIQ